MTTSKRCRGPFLEIPCALYRLTVVVTWGTTRREIVRHAKRHGATGVLSKTWIKEFEENTIDKVCNGLTMNLGDHNTDVLVWLRTWPRKSSDYGTLYHELFHATRRIARSHNLLLEEEAQAFLYEHLATACNRALWNGGRHAR